MILLDYGLNIGWTSTTTSFIVWTCLDWKPMDISFRRISGCCFPSTFIVPCLVIYIPKKNAESCTPGKYKGKTSLKYMISICIYCIYIYTLCIILYYRINLYLCSDINCMFFFSRAYIFFIQPFFASEKSTFSGSQVRPRPGFHAPSVQELQILRRNSSSDPVDPVSIDWPFKISLW